MILTHTIISFSCHQKEQRITNRRAQRFPFGNQPFKIINKGLRFTENISCKSPESCLLSSFPSNRASLLKISKADWNAIMLVSVTFVNYLYHGQCSIPLHSQEIFHEFLSLIVCIPQRLSLLHAHQSIALPFAFVLGACGSELSNF